MYKPAWLLYQAQAQVHEYIPIVVAAKHARFNKGACQRPGHAVGRSNKKYAEHKEMLPWLSTGALEHSAKLVSFL